MSLEIVMLLTPLIDLFFFTILCILTVPVSWNALTDLSNSPDLFWG